MKICATLPVDFSLKSNTFKRNIMTRDIFHALHLASVAVKLLIANKKYPHTYRSRTCNPKQVFRLRRLLLICLRLGHICRQAVQATLVLGLYQNFLKWKKSFMNQKSPMQSRNMLGLLFQFQQLLHQLPFLLSYIDVQKNAKQNMQNISPKHAKHAKPGHIHKLRSRRLLR